MVLSLLRQRHLSKEDGSKVEIGEKLNLESLNFKRVQKIIVSHTAVYKEFKNEEAKRLRKMLPRFTSNKKYLGRYGRVNCFEREHAANGSDKK